MLRQYKNDECTFEPKAEAHKWVIPPGEKSPMIKGKDLVMQMQRQASRDEKSDTANSPFKLGSLY